MSSALRQSLSSHHFSVTFFLSFLGGGVFFSFLFLRRCLFVFSFSFFFFSHYPFFLPPDFSRREEQGKQKHEKVVSHPASLH